MYDKMPFQFVFLVDTLLSFLCDNKKIAICKAWCNRLLQSVWRLRGCLAERALVYAVLVAARGQGRWLGHHCACYAVPYLLLTIVDQMPASWSQQTEKMVIWVCDDVKNKCLYWIKFYFMNFSTGFLIFFKNVL